MTGKQLKGEKHLILLKDNKPREVIFDFNAMVELEDHIGGFDNLSDLNLKKLGTVRFLIWCGILHLEENLTEKQVGSLIPTDKKGLEQISSALTKALVRDFGETSKKKE
jgi:hypothetical protein